MTVGDCIEIPKRNHPGASAVLGVVLLVCAACQTGGPPPAATSGTQLAVAVPSPLTGPGREPIDTTERKAIAKAWGKLLSGRSGEADATVARFTSSQAELLRIQISLAGGPSVELQNRLETFVEEYPQFAAGWLTLSTAAESLGDEGTALQAARRSSRLWASGPFAGRADDLQYRWVTGRVERSRQSLAAGQPMEALSIVEQALALDPDSQPAILARAEALVQLQQGPEAEAALSQLGAHPEALILRAEMASARGNWQHAMDLLGALPDDHPVKDRSLRRAQLMWRMSILPPHVQDAVNSEAVTREQLAVILTAMVPSLEVQIGGTTPLMTDVIDLPSQRAILTATRLDIMSVDRVSMLFHPQTAVTGFESQTAIEAVCHISGFSPPLWCEAERVHDDECNLIKEPVKGMDLVEVLLSVELRTGT
ncbi:MAG: tetratricopeptide repeat protein [Acidobacteria bacterium]|nr:tetratricopeptide repeat protein [Acidobacteriota bacterium]